MDMTISMTLSEAQIKTLLTSYQDKISPKALPYVRAQLILSDATITIYTTGKAVFSGDGASYYANVLSPAFVEHGGSDEVGTGDVFGPVVVAACYVDAKAHEQLKQYPIQDSKKMTDDLMRSLGPILMSVLPHSLLILTNEKYNTVQKTNNLNAIKAKLHNQAYLHLSKKTTMTGMKIVDQFTPKATYFNYLKDEKAIYTDLHFETKAESKYYAVACASIIARYAFLAQLDAMSETWGMTIPKGASDKVDAFIHEFIEKHGEKALKKVAKLHFKNIQNGLNIHQD